MKKIILGLMMVFGCLSICSAQGSNKATVQEKKEIFKLIVKNTRIIFMLSSFEGGESKLAETLKVEKKDLNKDEKFEYIATLDNEIACGVHANCPSWVYLKTNDNYRLLLNTSGQRLTAQNTSTNQFVDLRSDGSDSAYETSYTIYKFNGYEYTASDCFKVQQDPKLKPKTYRIKCEEAPKAKPAKISNENEVEIGDSMGGKPVVPKAESKTEPVPKYSPKVVSKGVINGNATSLPKPVYPKEAKLSGISGNVLVQVTVNEEGNVISARAVSGNSLLHNSAVEAAFKAKFAPIRLSGQAVKFTGVIVYNFVP